MVTDVEARADRIIRTEALDRFPPDERARRILAESFWVPNPLSRPALRLAALEAEVQQLRQEAALAAAAIQAADDLLDKTKGSFRSRDVASARLGLAAALAWLGALMLCVAVPAHAQSTNLRRVDHALTFGLNLTLRSPAKPYRYNVPLPQPHQLPPSDVALYPEGAIVTRQLYAHDRGQPGWLHVGATGRNPLEETHPSDPPPKYGPSFDTPPDAILGGIIAEAWEQGAWRERSRLVLTARGVYFIAGSEVVPVVETGP